MKTNSVLDQIAESTRRRIEHRKQIQSLGDLQKKSDTCRKPLDFVQALSQGPQPRVIAEVKTQSPSKGVIQKVLDPVLTAINYQKAGAAAISVLTEPEYFGGHIDNLSRIREQLPDLALLQKDFIVDVYQIYEALFYGADAILLILSLLGESQASDFQKMAKSLGLSVLVEVHNEEEMKMALRMGTSLIGVNNRDLKSLSVSLEVSRRLAALIPPDTLVISESGIETREQIDGLLDLGYRGFLIGTSLMQHPDPAKALARLLQTVDEGVKA